MKPDILIDGKKIGNLSAGEKYSFDVSTGRHFGQVNLGSKSGQLELDFTAERSLQLECSLAPLWKRKGFLFGLIGMAALLLWILLRRENLDIRLYFALVAFLIGVFIFVLLKGNRTVRLEQIG